MEKEIEEHDCGCMRRKQKALIKKLSINAAASIIQDPEISASFQIFRGKRALVTGASRGIGRSVAKHLYHLGAHVIAVGRSETDLEVLAAEIPEIQVLELDISKWTIAERKLQTIGDIDLLVNCAGISSLQSILNITEEEIDQTFAINTKSTMNLTKIVAQNLIKRKVGGSIVSITSQSSTFGIKKHAIFGASKSAVEAFTRAAAVELGQYGIRVNCVSPVVILTKNARKYWEKTKDSKSLLAKIPLKRFGEIHEIVHAILFLLSDKSSMITGFVLPVDGGFSAC
ncbi:hypothetical protein HHI36_020058 [Cryptolaemus montrouzieri]|uniref:Ketoreductase domain-containing protein n=1 Tax=Cryptolaemus montrouzieri TaxID=559131 RepID=A0ABD2N9W5_9CUCU